MPLESLESRRLPGRRYKGHPTDSVKILRFAWYEFWRMSAFLRAYVLCLTILLLDLSCSSIDERAALKGAKPVECPVRTVLYLLATA